LANIETGMIKSTHLGLEDHGVLTCFINIGGDGWTQGFGGYNLGADGEAQRWIIGVLAALGLPNWESLVGTPVRVDRDGNASAKTIRRIGHFYKNQWFEAPRS
jgi:hypothetical protein